MILVTAIIPGITKNLRSTCIAACMAGLLILPGCASFQITIPDSDPIKPKGYTEGYLKKTMHAFFWGLVLDPQVLSAECNGQGINDVIIYRTLAHDFAGVITLGVMDANGSVLPVQGTPDKAGCASVAVQTIKVTAAFLRQVTERIRGTGHA